MATSADKKTVTLRSKADRVRYVLCFEVLLILLSAPVIAYALGKEVLDVGMLTIILSLKAMVINIVYNYFYDRFDARRGIVPTERGAKARLLHAFGFELTLTMTSLPIVMWWLQIGLLKALAMDAVIMAFIVLYTFVFTWIYDRIFPVSQAITESSIQSESENTFIQLKT
ncbi:Uncharacterized membrane protein [Oceanospirillum multiglobuliferum]|uniref:Chlorhexidine efflux transporter domain-containing protein n=1 Tax=Oceanospirillum multiglobuliferum TaxID=64969 RepID=A0A1T4N5H5_9GAMM|nr:PACE efflux transporter [Oceanospirillum multiglobuliferum]OPX55845.1 hypothetical protein BTE48_06500 [Oceanospirillum multiglobuliferum]SJZ74482.1 Uncharacterized membrane protein [Oceanospirillum multiglobuliferum]